MARPFKVLIPEQKEQFGVVARSLRLLRDGIQKRYGLKGGFKIYLTDGTTVDDEEYFAFLEPQTLLIVKHAIPSGDTKTSVVDLTSKQSQALVCTEDTSNEHSHQLKPKDRNVTSSQSSENKNAETQTSAVLSIQIAKVQGSVEWENGGRQLIPNPSTQPNTPYQQRQTLVQANPQAVVSNASSMPLYHANHTCRPSSQATHTYSAATSRSPVMTVQWQQLQNTDAMVLQELYRQNRPLTHYHQQQLQQISSQPQACNAVLRPSQRYYLQKQQQTGRGRNYIFHQLSSCGYGGTDVNYHHHHQQQLSCLPRR